MEEIQFLSCDLEQVQLESNNSSQADQVPILQVAEGLRQVQREFQRQEDDPKKVTDQKINKDEEVFSNSYFCLYFYS